MEMAPKQLLFGVLGLGRSGLVVSTATSQQEDTGSKAIHCTDLMLY